MLPKIFCCKTYREWNFVSTCVFTVASICGHHMSGQGKSKKYTLKAEVFFIKVIIFYSQDFQILLKMYFIVSHWVFSGRNGIWLFDIWYMWYVFDTCFFCFHIALFSTSNCHLCCFVEYVTNVYPDSSCWTKKKKIGLITLQNILSIYISKKWVINLILMVKSIL